MTNRPSYDPTQWPFVRQCQECGHKDIYRDPATYKGDSWKDIKCKRCKSEALDYGSKRAFTAQQISEYQAYEDWENEQLD